MVAVKIMPAGDSITYGTGAFSQGGYRGPLETLLSTRGIVHDMVGSQSDGAIPDPNHEGHSGWYITTLDTQLQSVVPTYTPDIVLVQIGTNDCALNYDLHTAAIYIGNLIDNIHAVNANIWVLVGMLPPGPLSFGSNVDLLNSLLPATVAARSGVGKRVMLVPGTDTIGAAGMSSDGVHPNAAGYTQIAGFWFNALLAVLASTGVVTAPTLAAIPTSVEATVDISWLGDGYFTSIYDDITDDVAGTPGVTIDCGKDGQRALSPPQAESADFELLNMDGRYSVQNPSSPFYQLALPGRPVRITARHGARRFYRSRGRYGSHVPYRGRAPYRLATTAIDLIEQSLQIGNQRVRLATLGRVASLVNQRITTAVYQSITTAQAIGVILTTAGWPALLTNFDVGETTFLYWWCDERSPWEALLEVLASEGPGALWVDGEGVLRFESRGHRSVAARSSSTLATFYDVEDGARTTYRSGTLYRAHRPYRGRTSGLWYEDMSYDPGFRNIVNRATFATKHRTLQSVAKIWEYGGTLILSPGQSRTLIIKPSDPFLNAQALTAGTDYTVTSGSLASLTLSAGTGLTAFLSIVAGGSGATIDGVTSSGIQLRAQLLTVTSETIVQNSVDATASINTFGVPPYSGVPRTLDVQGWPEISVAQAEAVCNAWVTRYQWARPAVTLKLKNGTADLTRWMLDLRVSDRITVRERVTGLSADCWVEGKTLHVGTGGRWFDCELRCELADPAGSTVGYVWDGATSLWDGPAVWAG